MDITITENPENALIEVGYIQVHEIAEFERKMQSLAASCGKNIEIDLSRLDYINSTCIGALINLKKAQKVKGKNVTIVKVNPAIHDILKRTSLVDLFNIK